MPVAMPVMFDKGPAFMATCTSTRNCVQFSMTRHLLPVMHHAPSGVDVIQLQTKQQIVAEEAQHLVSINWVVRDVVVKGLWSSSGQIMSADARKQQMWAVVSLYVSPRPTESARF